MSGGFPCPQSTPHPQCRMASPDESLKILLQFIRATNADVPYFTPL